MRRGGSGEMTRAMPYMYSWSRMKKKKGWGGECVNQDEHRRLRRLMGDGLWTRLGKKMHGYKQFPGNKSRMMPLPLRRHWRLQVTESKRKKTWQEMRSRNRLRISLRMRRVFCSKVVRQAFNSANNYSPCIISPHQFTSAFTGIFWRRSWHPWPGGLHVRVAFWCVIP
jgi:hypothetical protein